MNTSITSRPTTVRKLQYKTNKGYQHSKSVKSLLICGIVAPSFYVAMNIIVPFYFPGYDVASQTVSELSAIDAPSRELWISLAAIYSVLVLSFSAGVWLSRRRSGPLQIVAALLFVMGMSGFFWPPMHLREELAAGGGTFTDTMHIVFAIFTVMLMMLMIIAGAFAFGKTFRIYSFLSLVLLLVFGTLTAIHSPALEKNLATPLLGVWERIDIGVYMLWMIALAVVLLRKTALHNDRLRPLTQ